MNCENDEILCVFDECEALNSADSTLTYFKIVSRIFEISMATVIASRQKGGIKYLDVAMKTTDLAQEVMSQLLINAFGGFF